MIRAALVCDGSSDRVLVPILEWVLDALGSSQVTVEWLDTRMLRPAASTLEDRITRGLVMQPADLLFVHRDAEAQDPSARFEEIQKAVAARRPHVAVVPVRMQEAWLLHDEAAIREAAGRPSGTDPLDLPHVATVHHVVNPKTVLYGALRKATGFRGRRLDTFRPEVATHRLAHIIEDWAPLRAQESFRRLEEDTQAALRRILDAGDVPSLRTEADP